MHFHGTTELWVENICGVVFCGRSWESSTQVLAIQMTEKNPLQIVRTRKTEWQCFGTENWHKRERHRAKWEKNWCSAKSFKRICTYGDNDHFLYSYSVSALPSHYMLFLLSICLFDVAVGHYCLRLCVPVNDDYKCSIRARNPAVNVMFDQEQEYADWNWLTSSTFEISNLSNIEIQRNNTPLFLSLVMNRSSAIGELPQKLTRFINFRLYAFFTQGLFGEFYYWPNKEKNCSVGRFAAMSSISMRWKRFVTQFKTFKLAKSFIVSETEWFVKLASFVLVLNWMLIGLLTTQIHFHTQF